MKLAIIGAGDVGGTLGTAWARKAGHDVFFGVTNPHSDKTQGLVRQIGSKARAGTAAEAAAFGDFVVLATPWPATEAAIRSMGDLRGRIVLDCTNPLAMGPDRLRLVIGHDSSGAEEIAKAAPRASVFKTLNQTGAENMAEGGRLLPQAHDVCGRRRLGPQARGNGAGLRPRLSCRRRWSTARSVNLLDRSKHVMPWRIEDELKKLGANY